MIGIAVIGYGYWGPNMVRNFREVSGCQVIGVADLSESRLALVRTRYPELIATRDATSLMQRDDVHAVVIATPVHTHRELAMTALEHGKHVLVEKPLTHSSKDGLELIEAARKRGLVLLVDHTFIYSSPVRKLKELVDSGSLGEVYYYDAVRVNLGLFQPDVNVLWDLAVHDLAIMDYIIPEKPIAVSALAMSHFSDKPEDMAYITLKYPGRIMGHVHVNWLAPVKVRRTLIGASQKMVVYDDLEATDRIKVYDRGVTVKDCASVYDALMQYRMGDMWSPRLDLTEALNVEVRHFLDCIEKRETPMSDGEAGLRVVRILEAASESTRNEGRLMPL